MLAADPSTITVDYGDEALHDPILKKSTGTLVRKIFMIAISGTL